MLGPIFGGNHLFGLIQTRNHRLNLHQSGTARTVIVSQSPPRSMSKSKNISGARSNIHQSHHAVIRTAIKCAFAPQRIGIGTAGLKQFDISITLKRRISLIDLPIITIGIDRIPTRNSGIIGIGAQLAPVDPCVGFKTAVGDQIV